MITLGVLEGEGKYPVVYGKYSKFVSGLNE